MLNIIFYSFLNKKRNFKVTYENIVAKFGCIWICGYFEKTHSFFLKKRYMFSVERHEHGIKVYICPYYFFDRWSNSRYISLFLSNNEEWDIREIDKKFNEVLKIVNHIPSSFYRKGIEINIL